MKMPELGALSPPDKDRPEPVVAKHKDAPKTAMYHAFMKAQAQSFVRRK